MLCVLQAKRDDAEQARKDREAQAAAAKADADARAAAAAQAKQVCDGLMAYH